VENWSLLKSSALNFCSENGLNNVGCIIISWSSSVDQLVVPI
jgi:hypothetical protein